MRALLPVGLAILAACDAAAPADDTDAVSICDDAPLPVTWDNFGRGFVLERCQSCHAGSTADRQGAPPDVVFDTEEDVWRWAPRILAVAASDPATMPPQGGVTSDDRYLLEVWLTCGG